MILKKRASRQIPGIISYLELFSSKKLALSIFFGIPFLLGLLSLLLNYIWRGYLDLFDFFIFFFLFLLTSGIGSSFSILFYSKRAPILRVPPTGWSIQMNVFFSVIMELTYIFGQLVSILLRPLDLREVFLMLGTILSYIVAFVIYFSFTTAGRSGNIILSLIQPVTAILIFSLYTTQFQIDFFARAMVFFVVSALFFAIPYRRGLFRVSNIYEEVTGMGGYPFIRAFILSMLTDGNDDLIESFFDKVGIDSDIKIQYLMIRKTKTKKIKGLFIIPNVHFGPFKTCGSSDLPEHIYKQFQDIPGTTVYHTTNDHTLNLTTQRNVEKVIRRIERDIDKISNSPEVEWTSEIRDFTRKISNSAKLIGTEINNVPMVFITRHPLPSDDIEAEVGDSIRKIALTNNYEEIIIIDSHNAIIGDEILIKNDTLEANDLIDVSKKFMESETVKKIQNAPMLYGVAKDSLEEFSELEGIGFGGIVVHLFKNSITEQKTVLIHFDANNAYVDVRSNILNFLQNRGIERGEITTSDSHTVARQFSNRGYSPIGDKIKTDFILGKLETLIEEAENDLEPVEFFYKDSSERVKIWGNPLYFNAIIDTLKACIKVSQSLLTISLIAPTFLSLILLIFLYTL
jgi:predicted neutral ceramidase superfamily lipid hydrolase